MATEEDPAFSDMSLRLRLRVQSGHKNTRPRREIPGPNGTMHHATLFFYLSGFFATAKRHRVPPA